MKKVFVFILCTALISIVFPLDHAYAQTGKSARYTAKALADAPVVDGVVAADEWRGIKPIKVGADNKRNPMPENITNDADLSYSMYAGHYDNTLYFAVDVVDDAIIADSDEKQYHDDSVEIYVDGDHEGIQMEQSSEGFQLRFTSDGGTYESTRVNHRHSLTKTKKGYTVEVAIPFNDIDTQNGEGTTPLAPGETIRFNIAVVDDDTGNERNHMLWLHTPKGVDVYGDQNQWAELTIA